MYFSAPVLVPIQLQQSTAVLFPSFPPSLPLPPFLSSSSSPTQSALSVSEPVTITVGQTDEQQLPTHNNNVQSQDTIAEEKTSPQTEQESDLFGAGVDSPDSGPHKGVASGGERRRRRTSSIRKTVMWVITEDNR